MPTRAAGVASQSKKSQRRLQQQDGRTRREAQLQAEVDEFYKTHDMDGNGILDREEFTSLLQTIFATQSDVINVSIVDRLVKSCEDHGGITKANVNRAIKKYRAYLNEMAAASAARDNIFKQFDKDGDGVISKDEMLPILKACAKTIKDCPVDEVRAPHNT